MSDHKEFLTKKKKKELEEELAYRKGEKRQEILDRLAFAKSLGDLSENAEYHSAKEEQGKNEGRIAQIEYILKHAVVVSGGESGEVALGSHVRVRHKEKGVEREYQIVGKEEADLSAGKIGFDSPIGSALLGTHEGDTVEVETPRGTVHYEVLEVREDD